MSPEGSGPLPPDFFGVAGACHFPSGRRYAGAFPDPRHQHVSDAQMLRKRAGGPTLSIGRPGIVRGGQNPLFVEPGRRTWTARTRLVVGDARQTRIQESTPPTGNGVRAGIQRCGDVLIRTAARGEQDHRRPSSPSRLDSMLPPPALQCATLRRREMDGRRESHLSLWCLRRARSATPAVRGRRGCPPTYPQRLPGCGAS